MKGLAILAALVLESGRRWGDVAAPFQLADAEAVLDGPPALQLPHALGRQRRSVAERPFGGSAGSRRGSALFRQSPAALATITRGAAKRELPYFSQRLVRL